MEKKLNKIFWYVFLILFMAFFTLFMAGKGGYYEYTQNKKKVFTLEQIKKFEEDVAKGIKIDINDYLVEKTDFQDKEKRMGLKISEFIGTYTKLGVNKIFKILVKLVEN